MMPNAILMYLKANGAYKWAVQMDSGKFNSIVQVSFNSDQSKIVVGLEPFAIVIVDSSNGAIISSY
jgi:hypothetical protein